LAVIFILLLNLFTAYYLQAKIYNLININNPPQYIENITVIIDDMNRKRYSSEIFFTIDTDNGEKLKGIILYQDDNVFNKGDAVFIHRRIKKINPANSYSNYLLAQGIHYSGNLNESDMTHISKGNPGFLTLLQNILLARISSVFPERTAGLIKALLTGNQNYIEKKIIIQYRNSGVLHTLSASGLHVAIFAAIPAFFLLRLIRKNFAMAVSMIFVTAYLLITDTPVSLLRAVIMFALYFIQLLMFRQRNILNYLMITCSVILLIMPWEIFTPGFQLSFGATAGIILFYKQYRKSLNGLPPLIADTTAVTLAAQVTTLPIILVQMNQINTAGLFSNLIIIPVITLIMGLTLFTLCLSFISITVAGFIGNIIDSIFSLSLDFTDFICGMNLNFFVYDISIILCILLLTGLLPLLNFHIIKKLKFSPVLISLILCTLYLKNFYYFGGQDFTIENGNSKAVVRVENHRQILKLSLAEGSETREIISSIKKRNPDIKIIELENSTYSTLLASKILMNDYVIDEFRFNCIPEPSPTLKKTLFQLEKDNIAVKFQLNKKYFNAKT
jgi:competence protein ComEC